MKVKEIYMIPDMENMKETLELSERYHAFFEYNDFFLPEVLIDEEEVDRRIQFYKSIDRDRSHDTLHGAFLDITIHSMDEEIRSVSEKRIRQSLSIAERLGIRGVVFHANLIAGYYDKKYVDGWLALSIVFWKKMLREYPEVEIFVENMFETRPDELVRLAEAMMDEPRFGICFDYAHASVFGKNASLWSEKFAPYVKHMHINDNDLYDDLHQRIGNGSIDWEAFSKEMRENNIHSSVLIEVKNIKEWEKSVLYMEQRSIFPW